MNYVQEAGVAEGYITTYPCNMFTEKFPLHDDIKYGYDSILLSNILHDWSIDKCELLCKKVYEALPDNGVVLVHENLLDDIGGPLLAALNSFDMFVSSPGKQFTFNEIKEMLIKSGFNHIGLIPTYGIYSVVYSKKINNIKSCKI